jgi:hypothetical protein
MDLNRLRQLAGSPVREAGRGEVGAMSPEEITAYVADVAALVIQAADKLQMITPELGLNADADGLIPELRRLAKELESL